MPTKILTKVTQETRRMPCNRAQSPGDHLEITARLPEYGTPGSAGADVFAFCPGTNYRIAPGSFAMISTGLRFELPSSMAMFILPRSSHPKNNKAIANSPGLLDEDYRGILHVLLANTGTEDMIVKHDDVIAQLVILPVYQMEFLISQGLSDTERGEGGFGSTDGKRGSDEN